uniref:Uncharacterized protein n=1 Tax=Arundo donax TaxID=35708 RepID=A0A0A9AG32_ARUDO
MGSHMQKSKQLFSHKTKQRSRIYKNPFFACAKFHCYIHAKNIHFLQNL